MYLLTYLHTYVLKHNNTQYQIINTKYNTEEMQLITSRRFGDLGEVYVNQEWRD